MKKLFCVLLTILFLCSNMMLLSSCEYQSDVSDDDFANEDFYVPENSWLKGASIDGTNAFNFFNGVALTPVVTEGKEVLYAIDKKGSLLFELENYIPTYDVNSVANGLVYVDDLEQGKTYLLKLGTPSELFAPEYFDGSEFAPYYNYSFIEKMFEDGYIVVNRTTKTFEGSAYEVAIFDASFNMLVDYSEDLYNFFYFTKPIKTYMDGYLIYDTSENGKLVSKVINVETGTVSTYTESEFAIFFSEDLCANMEIADLLKYGIVKESELGDMLNLNRYSTLYKISCVNDNMFLVIFSETSGIAECYFTLVDSEGNFFFDPIEYGKGSNSYFVSTTNGANGSKIIATNNYVFVINTVSNVTEGLYTTATYKLTTYDTSGKTINSTTYVRNIDLWFSEDFCVEANDEAIILADHDELTYYDSKLNVMCEN